MIGFETLGSGQQVVVVLNDWLCDTSTWDGARAYLDGERFTWVFADLRGYGRSRGQAGGFTLEQAVRDVLALGFERFAVVGHSMSSLVALHLGQHHAGRVSRVAVLAPPPPTGTGADEATLALMQGVALGDDEGRRGLLGAFWGDRLSQRWLAFKTERWRATSDPAAVAGYVAMFARDGLPEPAAPVQVPLFALTGEQDAPPMRSAAVEAALRPLRADVRVAAIADAGHYPMQEAPPLTVALLERFLYSQVT